MCRIFGFKSIIPSKVHNSLVGAENALRRQSKKHPHGWGVAYYVAGCPHLIKNSDSAIEDRLFQRVSGVVSAHTVVAHLRKATQGEHSIVNTHPFQHGPWVFAHNGHIHQFEKFRGSLLKMVHGSLRRYILGDTDSEVVFFIFLTKLLESGKALGASVSNEELAKLIFDSIDDICSLIGEHSTEDTECLERNYLSLILTNGENVAVYNGGKKLFYSNYKHYCSEREQCPSLSESCEAPSQDGYINHMIFSSEPLQGENIWIELEPGELAGVDASMKSFLSKRQP